MYEYNMENIPEQIATAMKEWNIHDLKNIAEYLLNKILNDREDRLADVQELSEKLVAAERAHAAAEEKLKVIESKKQNDAQMRRDGKYEWERAPEDDWYAESIRKDIKGKWKDKWTLQDDVEAAEAKLKERELIKKISKSLGEQIKEANDKAILDYKTNKKAQVF